MWSIFTGRFWATWRKRFCEPETRREYWSIEGHRIIFILLYVAANMAVGAVWLYYYWSAPPWIKVARFFGGMLNLNCAAILFGVMRTFLSWLRTIRISSFIDLDVNIEFHIKVAYWIAICGAAHGLAHYFNYSCCSPLYNPASPIYSPADASWTNRFGVTGELLVIVMVPLYAAAHSGYRQTHNFSVFWVVHHLFIAFYVLLLVHGRNFWHWFIGPGTLYAIERMLRIFRGHVKTSVVEVRYLQSNVIHVILQKEGFKSKSGQYAFINCNAISYHEWHPFTITSCPDDQYLEFHIRCVGDWTRALAEHMNPDRKQVVHFTPEKSPPIMIDGPFGAPAEHFWAYDYLVLIGAGIGVTPYASILKDLRNRRRRNELNNVKRIYFFWTNREEGSWEWFRDLLTEMEGEFTANVLQVHTYMTGALNEERIRQIMFTSDTYRNQANNRGTLEVRPHARVIFEYLPLEPDELHIEENEIVEVIKIEDGWCYGRVHDSERVGWFPGNFIVYLDQITQLEEGRFRHYGRPNWDEIFPSISTEIAAENAQTSGDIRAGVFFCGPHVMSQGIYKAVGKATGKGRVVFKYHKESF